MNTFRKNHLLKLLNEIDSTKAPLDLAMHRYFKINKAIGSKDRKWVAETLIHLIRWRSLYDYQAKKKSCWEEKLDLFQTLDVKKHIDNPSIPTHIRFALPKHLFLRLSNQMSEEELKQFVLASNSRAPTTLRINPLKIRREELIQSFLPDIPCAFCQDSPLGIVLHKRENLFKREEFKLGFFEMQDEASQLAALKLEAKPNHRVLDYCSGSGGKTLAFAHQLEGKGQIFLHDIRPGVLFQAKKRLKRAGIQNAQIIQPHEKKKLKKHFFDRIFLDVPCSGSGTFRRNPDLKWKIREEDVNALIKQQREIFAEVFPFLKKGGRILYATCSIFAEENEKQIAFFEKNYPLKVVGSALKTLPSEGGMDGFFAIALEKQ